MIKAKIKPKRPEAGSGSLQIMLMISADELAYFRRRAAAERELAYGSDNQLAASIHGQLARRYEALVDEPKPALLSVVRGQIVKVGERTIWHTDWKSCALSTKVDRKSFLRR